MRIGRKEALLALFATLFPWIGRRANAQDRIPLKDPTATRVVQSPEIVDLQRRVAALEAQLANQVAFVKDANGNLKLRGDASITIESAMHFTMKAGNQVQLFGTGPMAIRGSTIALN
jgi:hypothetical protein